MTGVRRNNSRAALVRAADKALITLLFAVVGCAPLDPRPAFDDVNSAIDDRIGFRSVWRTGGTEDLSVDEKIKCLLGSPLSIDDTVQIVLLNNPLLQATYEEVGVSQADLVQAGLLSNPVIGIERRFPGKALEVDVSFGFLELFFIPLRTRVAEASLDAAKNRVAHEVVTYAFQTRGAYFDLQSALQTKDIRRILLDISEAGLESARSLRAAGNITELDLRREELVVADARLQVATAEGEVIEAREKLNRLMGVWGPRTGWSIPGRLPEIPASDALPERLEPIAIESRLDLAAARHDIEAAAERVGIAQVTAIFPTLGVTSHYEREPEGDGTTGPSIDIPLPIFNWGRAASARSRAELIQLERRYTALAVDIRSETRSAYARMQIARARAEYLRRRVLPLQGDALHQSHLRFNGMLIGVFQLLEAKRSQVEAAMGYAQALRDYWKARAMLESAIGRALPTAARSDGGPADAELSAGACRMEQSKKE